MRRPSRTSLDRDELLGFLASIEHRLGDPSVPASTRRSVEGALEKARGCIGSSSLPEAERLLLEAARELDALRREETVREFPRGLVGYSAIGPAEAPTPEEEEPTLNRLKLVGRLLAVARRSDPSLERLVPRLAEGERAFMAGDRARARAIADEVLGELERRPVTGGKGG